MKFKIENVKVTEESYSDRKREPYKYRNKMYVWVSGENVLDNLMNRRNRPHQFYKKEIIPLIMEMIKEQNSVAYEKIKDQQWGWRQKCGCSMCPCSPGFVSDKDGMWLIHADVVFENEQ